MKAISRRLGKLEGRFSLVENEKSRRAHELVEAVRRAREGLPPEEPEAEREDLSGLSRSQILRLRYSRS